MSYVGSRVYPSCQPSASYCVIQQHCKMRHSLAVILTACCVRVVLRPQELRGLGMTATNEEPEWKVAALGKVR